MPKLLTELIHEVIQCLAIPYLNDNDRNALLTSHPVFRAWKRCMWRPKLTKISSICPIVFNKMVSDPGQQLTIVLTKVSISREMLKTLGMVHTLTLYWCKGITDVSALGGVHTLNLYGCEGITDVSALGGVHTLTLYGCEGITDVSKLGGVHTLIKA